MRLYEKIDKNNSDTFDKSSWVNVDKKYIFYILNMDYNNCYVEDSFFGLKFLH